MLKLVLGGKDRSLAGHDLRLVCPFSLFAVRFRGDRWTRRQLIES